MKTWKGDNIPEVRAIGESMNSLIDIGDHIRGWKYKKNLLNNKIPKSSEYPTTVKNGKSLESLFNGKK